MTRVNAMSAAVQSARGNADDITLLAQSNNPRAVGNTDLGRGVVQGFEPDGKALPSLVRIELGDPHPARLTEWLTGGAIKTALPENHGAREVARSAGVEFSKDGRSLNLPNDALGGQLFAQMQYTRWQRNSPYPMEWGPLIPKPAGTSAQFVAGFKAEWARMNNKGLRDLGAETLMNLGSALAGGRKAGRSGPNVLGSPQRLTPAAAVDNVRVSLSKFERSPSGANAVELNAALAQANALIKGQANRASLPDGLVKQYANLTSQAQNSLRNASRGADTKAPASAAALATKPTVTSPRRAAASNGSALRAVPLVTPLPTVQLRKVVPRVTPLPSGSSAPPGLQRFERRPGESMSKYLARQNVAQSLTPQQQRIADKNRMRMSATPPPPSGRIDKAAARAKAQTLNARETALLRGLQQGEQGVAIARVQGWSTQQFVAVRDSALHKLGVNDVRAAIKVAEAGGLLSTQAALPPEVAQATARYDQSAWRETILSEPPFAGVHLPPAQKQLFFTWIDNKMDLQGTVAAVGKPLASTSVMLNKLARRFGLSVAEMKAAVKAVVPTSKAEAPTAWPEAARQRFALVRDNAKVQRAQLTPRDIQLLSFWAHSGFKRGESASVLGLTAESMSVRLSRLSQALGFEPGAAGQRDFKRFLKETTALRRDGAAKADEASLLPPRGARYGSLNLSIGGLAQSLPGLNVNPLKSSTNCIGAAVALDRQRGGAPASALAIEVTNPADLNAFYGRLPEQGFTAKVNGSYLLPPKTRFDMASLQRYVGSLPNGARGILLVDYRMLERGHVLVVENVNGRAMFIDGQSGLVLDVKAISSGAMVLPALAGSGKAAGRGLADLPDVNYMFLRTDDVSRLDALPKGTRQAIVVQTEGGGRVRVADPTGVRGDEWIDLSQSPGLQSQIRLGANVYVVDETIAGKAVRTRLIPQDAALGH